MDYKLVNPIPIEDINEIIENYNNGFIYLEVIGEGAEGVVYKYKDYAIKYAPDSRDGIILEKFQDNPLFPKLFFYTEDFVVEEFIKVKERYAYDYFEKNVDININALDIYKYCYNKGYIPYDIHDENVVVTEDEQLKIIDVGSFREHDGTNNIHSILFTGNNYYNEYIELDNIINHVKKPLIAI